MTVRRLAIALMLLVLTRAQAWAGAAAPAAAPPVGTVITNRATATFIDADSGLPVTLQSNFVNVVVQPLEGLTLTQDQDVVRPPGTFVSLPHRLTNTGNVAATYHVQVQNLTGDAGDLANLAIYRDLDRDGTLDPGEPQIGPSDDLRLESGDLLDLVVSGFLAPSFTPGQTVRVRVTASSVGQGLTASNQDRVTCVEGPIPYVVKSASIPKAEPGAEVTFTVHATNVGTLDLAGRGFIVDGAGESGVILRDHVPANTSFVSAEGVGAGGRLLYHRPGDDVDTWLSAAPGSVDAIGYFLTALPPGGSITLRMRVRIVSYATSNIENTADLRYRYGGANLETPSNTAVVQVPQGLPTISYYLNDRWEKTTNTARIGRPLYVQVVWSGGNKDPDQVDRITITLSSGKTGDRETFTAVETGPNTGIFRILPGVPTGDGSQGSTPGDGILQTTTMDTILAQEGSSGFAVSAEVLVDPFGVVFDSRTNAPVPGATVTLIDVTGGGNGGRPGEAAAVFQDDGLTPGPSTLVTGSDGSFRFPLVPESTYRLAITPPAPYTFPSVVPPGLLPPGRFIDASSSYGGTFIVDAQLGAVRVDTPVDGAPPTGLFVEKSSDRDVVDIGEFVTYTVKVANASDAAFTDTSVTDDLPVGFAYQKGTTRVNRASAPDPAGGAGPHLRFPIGTLGIDRQTTITYRVRVGPGATLGDQSNRAQASGRYLLGVVSSNVASATVRVQAGVFSDRGILFGKVFVDLNGNREQDAGEKGVPGVRLYVDDGTSCVTDGEGKFSLYGLSARTHTVQVDRTTLPEGAEMRPLSNRNAGDGYGRFVDMKRADLHRADFAIFQPSETVRTVVEARRAAYRMRPDEAARALEIRMRPDGKPEAAGDVKNRPAAGTLGGESLAPPYLGAPPRGDGLTNRDSNLPTTPVRKVPDAPAPAQWMDGLSNEPGFLDYRDGDTLPMRQANVRVKGLAGTKLRLSVNGTVVSESRVGARHTLETRALQVWEYVGVDFVKGENTVRLEQVDSFGNVRETVTLEVVAPGSMGRIKLALPDRDPQADGKTAIPVVVEVVDDHGVAVTARTPVTLEADVGTWDAPDLDPREPNVQTFVTGGRAEFHLVPGTQLGECRVRVVSGALVAEGMLRLVAELRPLLITGIVEGVVDFRRASTGPVRPSRVGDLLETEMDRIGGIDGRSTHADGRISVFGKGQIAPETAVTFAYDSQKERHRPLFRDIEPLEYYPIYGDASVKGFEAQSTSPLFFRIDSGRDFLMHGDFLTAAPDQEQGLGTYSRSMTGAKGHLETGPLSVNTFAAYSQQRQMVEEISANGTSGPYPLGFRGYVANSEKVEIVTRDRNQPGVVLKVEPQTRFTDYVVDRALDGLLFRKPVPSLDANLNPVFVRVVYEIDQGGPSFWTYGGDLRLKLVENLWIGGTYARDENLQDPYQLWSANATFKLSSQTRFVAEFARSNRSSLGQGSANRFEILHDDGRFAARFFTGRSDEAFDNPTAILGRGRSETSFKSTWRIDDKTRARAEFIRTADVQTSGARTGYDLAFERVLTEGFKLELGARHATGTTVPALPGSVGTTPNSFTTARLKLTGQVPGVPEAQLFGEYEQDLGDSRRRALALGGEYQFANRSRIYARHELLSSLTGRYGLNNQQNQAATVFGIDTDYMKDGHLFSEYRVRDAISGREAEAAIGLRNQWTLARGLKVNTGFERVVGGGLLGDQHSAVTAAAEYTASDDLKATGRFEYRTGGGTRALLRNLGFAWRVNPDWSLLGRDVSETVHDQGGSRQNERALLGVAYRPVNDNRVAGLFKIERRGERNDPDSQTRRTVTIASMNVNYAVDPRLTLSAFLAAKWAREEVAGVLSDSTVQMAGGRLLWDVSDRWDLAIQGARLFTPNGASDQYTVGAEVGYLLTNDIWLALGYNATGFTDRDLSGESYTAPGPFIRLRFKLGVDEFRAVAPAAPTGKQGETK